MGDDLAWGMIWHGTPAHPKNSRMSSDQGVVKYGILQLPGSDELDTHVAHGRTRTRPTCLASSLRRICARICVCSSIVCSTIDCRLYCVIEHAEPSRSTTSDEQSSHESHDA